MSYKYTTQHLKMEGGIDFRYFCHTTNNTSDGYCCKKYINNEHKNTGNWQVCVKCANQLSLFGSNGALKKFIGDVVYMANIYSPRLKK